MLIIVYIIFYQYVVWRVLAIYTESIQVLETKEAWSHMVDLSYFLLCRLKKMNKLDLQGHDSWSSAATDVLAVIGERQHGLGASSVPLTVNFKLK